MKVGGQKANPTCPHGEGQGRQRGPSTLPDNKGFFQKQIKTMHMETQHNTEKSRTAGWKDLWKPATRLGRDSKIQGGAKN